MKIEIPCQKPLLFSYNLSFIKPDPDHPRYLRVIYNVESKKMKMDCLQFEQKNIMIGETQQTVETKAERCDGWKRTLTMFKKCQPQLHDSLFHDNNQGKVRIFKNSDTINWNPVEIYTYGLEKLDDDENNPPEYKSLDPEFYGPEGSEISSPRTMVDSPELLSCSKDSLSLQSIDAKTLRSIDAQGTDKLSKIGSICQNSNEKSPRNSLIPNQS